MRFAFAIVSLFPGGGLQRDCVDIAQRVRALGHQVTIFTSRKSADNFAADLPLRILNVESRSNHGRQRAFSDAFQRNAGGGFDLRVGFDKLDGLDVLYCSDRSMLTRVTRNAFLRLLPRYREYIRLERSCFAAHSATKILLLSEPQLNEYWTSWTTEQSRLTVLPPTLAPERRQPECRKNGTRERWRALLGLTPKDRTWLAICVQPKTKGLDRTINALCHFPDANLLVVGLRENEERAAKIRYIAARFGVANRIRWLGHREDVPELMAAADLLVHPARLDTTGTVILEAVANGLPSIATSCCGYARHISIAGAGLVLQEPFRLSALVSALKTAHEPGRLAMWAERGRQYGKEGILYEGRRRAAELMVANAAEGKMASQQAAKALYSPAQANQKTAKLILRKLG